MVIKFWNFLAGKGKFESWKVVSDGYKQLRGKGIAQQLVHDITDRVFTNFFDIQACVASCNSASYKALASYDYQPMSASQMAIEPSNGKIPLLACRDRWINYRNYQTMYNKGNLWTT